MTKKNGVFWDVTPCDSLRTDDSEELSASFIRVTRIGELGTTLAVTSNRRNLCAQRGCRYKTIRKKTACYNVGYVLDLRKQKKEAVVARGENSLSHAASSHCFLVTRVYSMRKDWPCLCTSLLQSLIHLRHQLSGGSGEICFQEASSWYCSHLYLTPTATIHMN
jgi:hypothetical protein